MTKAKAHKSPKKSMANKPPMKDIMARANKYRTKGKTASQALKLAWEYAKKSRR